MLFVCIIICLQKKTLLLWFRKFLLHHEMSSTFPSWGHKHLSKNGMNEHQAAIFTWTFDILRATHCVHFSTQASWNQNLEKLNVIIKHRWNRSCCIINSLISLFPIYNMLIEVIISMIFLLYYLQYRNPNFLNKFFFRTECYAI